MKEEFKFPFNPTLIYRTAMDVIGYDVIHNAFPTNSGMCHTTAVILTIEDLFQEYEYLGKTVDSEDILYAIKRFIDNMLIYAEIDDLYQSKFGRVLQVVEKSEGIVNILNNVNFCLN